MKTPLSIAVAAVLLVMTFLVMGAANPKKDNDDTIDQLSEKIRILEQRVDSLESKLQNLSEKIHTPPRRLPSPPSIKKLPRDRQRRESYRYSFYIVPLNQKQSRSSHRNLPKTNR